MLWYHDHDTHKLIGVTLFDNLSYKFNQLLTNQITVTSIGLLCFWWLYESYWHNFVRRKEPQQIWRKAPNTFNRSK